MELTGDDSTRLMKIGIDEVGEVDRVGDADGSNVLRASIGVGERVLIIADGA